MLICNSSFYLLACKAHCKLFMCHPQVTAAGDQMAKLWDVKSGDLLGSFKGHLCSLKSVAFAPQEKGTSYTWPNILMLLFVS